GPHGGQLTAGRQGSQGEQAGEQHGRRHQLEEPGWRGQEHVEQGVYQAVPAFADVMELIHELQQAE
ncbi:hypothetical protein RCL33_24510, partial [Salmonella enterica subsp. enterica serovar 1,4,[5],12:i:-]